MFVVLFTGQGAKKIHFQDFNEEVLINLTIPNVQANLRIRQQHPPNSPVSPPPHPETRFFSGDWDDVASVLKMISPSNSQHVEHTEKREEPGGRRRRAVSFATEDEGLNSNPAQHKLLLGTPSFCIRGNTTEEGGGLYDVILTSETVYSRRSMVKLLNIMKKVKLSARKKVGTCPYVLILVLQCSALGSLMVLFIWLEKNITLEWEVEPSNLKP